MKHIAKENIKTCKCRLSKGSSRSLMFFEMVFLKISQDLQEALQFY